MPRSGRPSRHYCTNRAGRSSDFRVRPARPSHRPHRNKRRGRQWSSAELGQPRKRLGYSGGAVPVFHRSSLFVGQAKHRLANHQRTTPVFVTTPGRVVKSATRVFAFPRRNHPKKSPQHSAVCRQDSPSGSEYLFEQSARSRAAADGLIGPRSQHSRRNRLEDRPFPTIVCLTGG